MSGKAKRNGREVLPAVSEIVTTAQTEQDVYITIPVAEYVRLQRLAAMLDVIMHDHTIHRESIGIVKNVLIANGMRAEAGVEE